MSKKIKKVALPVGALTLVGAIGALTASQLAYLTAEETATNIFTIGDVDLDVKEPNYPGNDSDEVKHVLPNQKIAKDPQIENTGENDAFAFADITLPAAKVKVVKDDGTELDAEAKNQILFETIVNKAETDGDDTNSNDNDPADGINDAWSILSKTYYDKDDIEVTVDDEDNLPENVAYVKYHLGYNQILAAGETTPSVFDSVKMKNVVEGDINGTVQEIAITGMAIQSSYLSDEVNSEVDSELYNTDTEGKKTLKDDGALTEETMNKIYTIFTNQNSTTEQDADISNKLDVKGNPITMTNTIVEINPTPEGGEAGATDIKVAETTTFTPSVKTYSNGTLTDAADWTVSSNNPSVATAEKSEDGTKIVVTGISEGTATITMESEDGARARVTVTVDAGTPETTTTAATTD
jgi:hypothetical protein